MSVVQWSTSKQPLSRNGKYFKNNILILYQKLFHSTSLIHPNIFSFLCSAQCWLVSPSGHRRSAAIYHMLFTWKNKLRQLIPQNTGKMLVSLLLTRSYRFSIAETFVNKRWIPNVIAVFVFCSTYLIFIFWIYFCVLLVFCYFNLYSKCRLYVWYLAV